MLVGLVVSENICLDTKIMIMRGPEVEIEQNMYFHYYQGVYVNLGVDEMFSSLTSLIYVAQTS